MAKQTGKKKVLFICTHNSARSQMAEGLMNSLLGDRYEAHSAGTEATLVRPHAIAVLAEVGIDISSHRSKTVREFEGVEFEYVVTVCDNARENCPYFPGAGAYMHMGFTDPAAVEGSEEEKTAVFREVRDEITAWLKKYFE